MLEEEQTHSIKEEKPALDSEQVERPIKKEIDLNLLFPDETKDLNSLFPESEMKSLLKKVSKNRTDIKKITERFQEELSNNSPSIQNSAQESND